MVENAPKQLKLFDDIERDAADEARKIVADAAAQAEERVRQCERQIGEIRAEAQKTADVQVAAVKKTLKAAFAVELKRILLRSRDNVFKRILDGVEEELARRRETREYRNILLSLIAEAAIGLGAAEVEVNASPDELALIDSGLLKESEEKVKAVVLRTVKIKKSQAAPLLLQGIVMNSSDGKTAYNNQIQTRLLRNQTAIRKIIYERLSMP
jgi:vacuolar-type H+-ATPase subunit E/Vma4